MSIIHAATVLTNLSAHQLKWAFESDSQRCIATQEKENVASRRRLERRNEILSRLRSGQEVSSSDKSFLRRYFPPDYSSAREVEVEAQRLEILVRSSRSKDEARSLLRNSQHSLVFMSAARRVENNIGSMDFGERHQDEEDRYFDIQA